MKQIPLQRSSCGLLVWGLLLVACQTALAAPAPTMTMHRVQAGEPDAAGSVLATSTEGGFSVRLPIKFNDFTVIDNDPAAAVARSFTVGGVTPDGVKLSATRVVYREGASAERFFAKLTARGASGPRPAGGPSATRTVDLVDRSSSAVVYQRAVLAGETLILLAVEAPGAPSVPPPKMATAFFDSLQITRP
jgi:hypothetical protein